MIEELSADADTFEKLAADIHEGMKSVREKLGLKDEALDAQIEKQMAGTRGELPLK
jgi:hypothetical protein